MLKAYRSMGIGAEPGAPIEVAAWKRWAALLYGVVCYAAFFGTFLYAAGWVGNFLTPTRLDGPAEGPLWQALLINVGLLTLFALQHSVMARPGFKRWWTRFVPRVAERSTYTLMSSVALLLMFWLWRPMGGEVWSIEHPAGQGVMYALFAFGWGLVLVTTFLINHFDLFGLRHVWLYFRGRAYAHLKFVTPGPYRYVRHPLYVGWIFAFWATPTMTLAHLLFAAVTTAYILVAIQLEERDLMKFHPEYAAYRRRTGMLTPRVGRGGEGPEVARPA